MGGWGRSAILDRVLKTAYGTLFDFSPLCFLKCVLKWPAQMMQSHTGCISWTFLECVFSNVSLNGLPEKRHSHIGCICLTFLHCGFSNEFSNGLPVRMQSRIGCMCITFLHCAFSNVSPNCFTLFTFVAFV